VRLEGIRCLKILNIMKFGPDHEVEGNGHGLENSSHPKGQRSHRCAQCHACRASAGEIGLKGGK
jgi:hypothetical protein